MTELGQGVEFHEVTIPTDVQKANRLKRTAAIFTELATQIGPERSLVWPPEPVRNTADPSSELYGYVIPSVPNQHVASGFYSTSHPTGR